MFSQGPQIKEVRKFNHKSMCVNASTAVVVHRRRCPVTSLLVYVNKRLYIQKTESKWTKQLQLFLTRRTKNRSW